MKNREWKERGKWRVERDGKWEKERETDRKRQGDNGSEKEGQSGEQNVLQEKVVGGGEREPDMHTDINNLDYIRAEVYKIQQRIVHDLSILVYVFPNTFHYPL